MHCTPPRSGLPPVTVQREGGRRGGTAPELGSALRAAVLRWAFCTTRVRAGKVLPRRAHGLQVLLAPAVVNARPLCWTRPAQGCGLVALFPTFCTSWVPSPSQHTSPKATRPRCSQVGLCLSVLCLLRGALHASPSRTAHGCASHSVPTPPSSARCPSAAAVPNAGLSVLSSFHCSCLD